MQRALDARREIGSEVGEVTPLPGQIVVAEQDAARMPGRDAGDDPSRLDVERERAEVVDDHEVGAVERTGDGRVVDLLVDRATAGRVDREAGQDGVVGPAVVLDRPGDAADVEAELAERPRPLAGLDGDAVGAAETERHDHSFGRHEHRR